MDKFLRGKDLSSGPDDEEPSISVAKKPKKIGKRKHNEDYIKYGFSSCGDERATKPFGNIRGSQLSNAPVN